MGLFFYQKMMLGCEEVWWRWRLLMMESYRILKEFGGTFWFGLKGFFLLIFEKWEISRETQTQIIIIINEYERGERVLVLFVECCAVLSTMMLLGSHKFKANVGLTLTLHSFSPTTSLISHGTHFHIFLFVYLFAF